MRAGFALGQLLADAQDRDQPLGERGGELARDQLVALAVQQPPLGVADDHVLAADVLQHGRGHLAGEGALRSAQTSCAPRLSAESRSRRATSCRYTNGGQTTQVGRRLGGSAGQQLLDEPRVLGARAVHLPVAGDDGAAHGPAYDGLEAAYGVKGRAMIAMQRG